MGQDGGSTSFDNLWQLLAVCGPGLLQQRGGGGHEGHCDSMPWRTGCHQLLQTEGAATDLIVAVALLAIVFHHDKQRVLPQT